MGRISHHVLRAASEGSALIFLFLSTLYFSVSGSRSVSGLALSFDNVTRGYSIDVLIDGDVPEVMPRSTLAESQQTLKHIMKVFAKASKVLHNATRHHAHIGKVRFLLPDSWPRDHLPGALQCRTGTQRLQAAIKITYFPSYSCTDARVVDDEKCGKQAGRPMTLPLASIGRYSTGPCPSPAKILVHEFAHLRWGVKDEYLEASGVKIPKCPSRDGKSWQSARKKRKRIGSLMASLKKSVSLMRYELLEDPLK